jgi:uncharacterized protein (TIGR02594 family)
MAGSAAARPTHKHHRKHARPPAAAMPETYTSGADSQYTFMRADWERMHGRQDARAHRAAHGAHQVRHAKAAHRRPAAAPRHAANIFTGNALVAEARKYIGTNPTGRSRLWCGAFMDMVLERTGHRGGGNLARGYAHYGRRISGPQIGAIAVMGRRGGGHVGVVSGIDERGNPIVVSGNHNRTVAESVYPRSRVLAYVMPGN